MTPSLINPQTTLEVPMPRTQHCLSCAHAAIRKDGVRCQHPERPDAERSVVKWYGHSCKQWEAPK